MRKLKKNEAHAEEEQYHIIAKQIFIKESAINPYIEQDVVNDFR